MSSTEYGIFTDEGLLEQDFWDYHDAEAVMDREYAEEPYVHVGEVCGQCRGAETTVDDGCEDCDDELDGCITDDEED
ncbi:hypothetical protein HOT75_gp138 [Gordonia phage Daredevil]|uniref:Uncharacterized protein n=1 Tax=Gordonia phage Daredevil TaxID=2283286 RepID=A0A345MIZ3_9CAUD|nr:hypothetical protein HOT75_gp138 [Gordonia phage Daredevil]AXH70524.1 hypothetical protein SEA_DAREDEVIL_138 [Gordonia phage Daredevil]